MAWAGPLLTFDDGPSDHTVDLLDVLKENDVLAVFFVQGDAIADREQILIRMVEEGHRIGNHGWDHVNLTSVPYEGVVRQLERTQDEIERVIGERPHDFRPPYGESNQVVRRAATAVLGSFQEWTWDVDPRDWQMPGVDAVRDAIIGAKGGQIVLLHDAGAGAADTVEAVRQALEMWRERA